MPALKFFLKPSDLTEIYLLLIFTLGAGANQLEHILMSLRLILMFLWLVQMFQDFEFNH